jgi:hypothetical protein
VNEAPVIETLQQLKATLLRSHRLDRPNASERERTLARLLRLLAT